MLQRCIVCIVLVVSSMASVARAIHDPNSLLPDIRNFMGQAPFSEAFHCGDVSFLKVFRISCEFEATENSISSQCMDIPEGLPVQRQVVNCTEDSVAFYVDVTGESVTLSAEEYSKAGQSSAVLFLETLPQFIGYNSAQVTITSAESSTYTIGRGTAGERKVPSMNIRGTLGEPNKKALDIIVSVIREAPGVAQVVRLRTDNYSWFLLGDYEIGKAQ
jgi:hypothetical protein